MAPHLFHLPCFHQILPYIRFRGHFKEKINRSIACLYANEPPCVDLAITYDDHGLELLDLVNLFEEHYLLDSLFVPVLTTLMLAISNSAPC